MTNRQIEAYNYYKNLKPEALIVFHLPGRYVLVGEDIARAQKSTMNNLKIKNGVGELPDEIAMLSLLSSDGSEIHLVEYRNSEGILDFPDSRRLKDEKEKDY